MTEKDFEITNTSVPETAEDENTVTAQQEEKVSENVESALTPEVTPCAETQQEVQTEEIASAEEAAPEEVPAFENETKEAVLTDDSVAQTPSVENSYGGFSHKWNYERKEDKSKKGRGIKIFAAVMSVLFVATLSAFVTYFVMDKKADKAMDNAIVNGDNVSEEVSNTPIADKIINAPVTAIPEVYGEYTGEELTSQEIIALASPSVVGIRTMVEQNYGWYFGTQTYEGVGSGFIITSDGYIVTNYHVIEDAVSIMVILADGTEYEAEVIGFDELSDVAVLKVEAQNLPALVIGNSDAVIVGDTVIAIGCPSGIDLAGTATRGMVSMVNREISITDSYGRLQKMMSVIQIDAAINPGNSGGPLLNSRGEVIGINTLKLSSTSYEGIGFALPINGVMKLVDQICENGAVVERPTDSFVTGKAALGITYREITAAESKKYQLPQGVLVVLLSQGGAAQKGGMKSGDIIVEFDGKETITDDKLIELIDSKKPGDVVNVRIHRDGEYMELDVTLTEASE